MDSDKVERLRERLLQCAICMDEYKDPRILPCHHTLCFECIESVVQSSSATGRFFRCPQCRSDVCVPRGGIAELPINFYIISLLDELGTKGYSSTCSVCEREWLVSQFRCIDCDLDICRFCIHAHRLDTHVDPPKILRIETTVNKNQVSSNLGCSVHPEEILQLFCSTCNRPICIACSCGVHKKHKFVPISVKLRESQGYLQSQLDKLTAEKRTIVKTAEELNRIKADIVEISNKSMLALDAAAHRACEMIAAKKSQIEKEILSSEKEQVSGVEEALKDHKSYMQKLERGVAFLLDLQENDICLEVVDAYKDFSTKLAASRMAFTSNHIGLERFEFKPSDHCKVSDVNFGFCRKLYHYGQLGKLSAKKFCLKIDQRTLGLTRRPRGLLHILENKHFVRLFKFLVAFFIFQILFYLADMMGCFEWLSDQISLGYQNAVNVLSFSPHANDHLSFHQ